MQIEVMKDGKRWAHTMSLSTWGDKWEAYDDARARFPSAIIKVEGVGVFNGDGTSEVSRIRGETAPTERHS